jgi:superfamily II DNA or RNA helicase
MPEHSILDRKNLQLDAGATLTVLPPGIAPGALVTMRGVRWRVWASVQHADCHELHLRGTAGEARTLLWPFDRPALVAAAPRLRAVTPRQWLRRARALAAIDLDAHTPRGRFRGEVLPYQLGPAVAVALGAPRVLLADEVGLGKTVQAGWILADLRDREPDARALIAVPASLRDQWASEIERLFSVEVVRVDAAWLRAAVSDRAADVSPWAAPGVYLGSIDFLKRPDVASSLRDLPWDLLIVDEAHTATAPTERHAALARVAAVARRVAIISATPYSGDAAAFSSMVSLGGSTGGPLPLLFRRSRLDVGDPRRRRHRFALVRISAAETRLQRLLERYTRKVWADAPVQEPARLAMTVLRKRALSSAAAAARSLSRRLDLLRGAPAAPRQLGLFDESPETDEDLPEAALATPGLADASEESRWLTALVGAAGRAMGADSKLRHLQRLVARTRREPLIVFTEYRDTLRQLAEAFPQALQLHGGLAAAERTLVQRRFNEDGGMLLATDAAADGLNLQRRCRMLVNYELPWNPARLEQRIGRVDRIGQRRRVHAVSLVARDTAEDLVVAPLARRLARVSAALGERDRLAAFLSDARVARTVIAGESSLPIEEPGAAPILPRPAEDGAATSRAAVQVATRRVPAASDIPVAQVRAALLPEGASVILRAALVNDSGCVAERAFVLHVRPPLAGTAPPDALAFADLACTLAERNAPFVDPVQAWSEEMARIHRIAVEARLDRERELRQAHAGHGLLQPGLFDPRVLGVRPGHDAVDEARDSEYAQRVQRLTLSLDVRLVCSPLGVLLSWR